MFTNELKFTDVKPEELVGRSVLCSGRNQHEFVDKIVKVTNTGFRISQYKDTLFNFHGASKGGDAWTRIWCKLLTDEDAVIITKKHQDERMKLRLIKQINLFLPDCDLSTVELIHQTILNSKNDQSVRNSDG